MPRKQISKAGRPRALLLVVGTAAGLWAWWAMAQAGIDARTRTRLVRA